MGNNNTRHTPEQHRMFLDALWYSEPARWRIARWFSNEGHAVWVPPNGLHHYEGHMDRIYQNSDDGDIHITQRVEVRQITAPFTCREDWPFKDFIVATRYEFDRAITKPPRPVAYMVVNPEVTHMAYVLTMTRQHWHIETRNSRPLIDIGPREYYITTLDHVRFVSLKPEKPDTWNIRDYGDGAEL